MVSQALAAEFAQAWRVGPSGLRPLFKKYPADVSAEAIQVVLDEAGWDSDYGPVIEAVPEGEILDLAVTYMSESQLKRFGVILPVEGVKDIGSYLNRDDEQVDTRTLPDDDIGEEWVYNPTVEDPDDQFAINLYRLGRHLLPQMPEETEFYDEGVHAFLGSIDNYEIAYKAVAPWYPVLPHDIRRAGRITFFDEVAPINAWSPTTAPLMWELTRETLAANFNPEFQQWWLSTGLRSLTIERDFYRDLTYSESRLQRFSISGVTATATWRWGRLGIEDADPVQMVRSVHEQSLQRVAQRRKVPPAPFPR